MQTSEPPAWDIPGIEPRTDTPGQERTTSVVSGLLRELGGLIVEIPARDSDARASRTGVSIERTAQVAGLQAILLPLLTAPLLAITPPTDPLGAAGWPIVVVLLLTVIAVGTRLVRQPVVSGSQLAASNAYTTAVLGVLTWLGGGFASPFPLLLPLVAASIAPHAPRLRRELLLWIVVVASLPLFYNGWNDRDGAEALMIVAVSVGTLLTLLWLSSRVRRSEVGLIDAAAVARRELRRAEARAGELEEVDSIRDRLVEKVSHELRTPLTSIKGYLEALLEGEGGRLRQEQSEYAQIALRNTLRLERIIDDLLLLSSVEAGQVRLEIEDFDLAESLGYLREEILPIARERNVHLRVDVAAGTRVRGDRDRIEQAVANLIVNAIKYSPTGSPVTIRAQSADDEIRLEVIDSGVGIPEAELSRIGQRFFRASTAGETKGTGLGIAITRELVELHGGAVEVDSTEGTGSTFRLRLPRSPGRS